MLQHGREILANSLDSGVTTLNEEQSYSISISKVELFFFFLSFQEEMTLEMDPLPDFEIVRVRESSTRKIYEDCLL